MAKKFYQFGNDKYFKYEVNKLRWHITLFFKQLTATKRKTTVIDRSVGSIFDSSFKKRLKAHGSTPHSS